MVDLLGCAAPSEVFPAIGQLLDEPEDRIDLNSQLRLVPIAHVFRRDKEVPGCVVVARISLEPNQVRSQLAEKVSLRLETW